MPSLETIDLLLQRRSVSPRDMQGEGPTAEQIDTLLRAAHRVPDHGKLGPWRFVVFTGDGRAEFGRRLGAIYQEDFPAVAADLAALVTMAAGAPCPVASPIQRYSRSPTTE